MIAKKFLKTKANYAQNAKIQRSMANELLSMCAKLPREPSRVFEFGCNAGLLTKEAIKIFKPNFYLCNDIIDASAEIASLGCQRNLAFMRFDMNDFLEHLKLSYDLVLSNAALHWCDGVKILSNIDKIISPGGHIALSTFGAENLSEIRALTGVGLEYLSYESYPELLKKFQILKISRKKLPLRFPRAIDAFYHLKYTGVNSLAERFYISKKLLSNFALYFDNTLTYDAIFIVAKRLI